MPSTLTVRSSAAVLGERHLGDVVVHDVDAVDGARDGRGVADVAGTTSTPGRAASVTSMSSSRTSSPRATSRSTRSGPK